VNIQVKVVLLQLSFAEEASSSVDQNACSEHQTHLQNIILIVESQPFNSSEF
jgi:hypothetical protein